ncbi:hypothetical protein PAMP_012956 [Pampus punctatissimus]
MLGNSGFYATKRRKKPAQKSAKAPPVKTNPSKRHRDRLNVELDRLTSLLPFSEEVRGRLDKLSVLRLSVGYLKVKTYFHAANARSAPLVSSNGSRNGQFVSLDGVSFSEGDLLLQALDGFVLVVATDGSIFYTSSTIQNFLGFQQSDVVHQSVYDLVHMDDREMFRCQLRFDRDTRAEDVQSGSQNLFPAENSSFLERSFCCRLRCLLDNTSGFMTLCFNGRLKYLNLRADAGADGRAAPPQLALFAIAAPLQPPSVMEIRTKTLIFQTKHSMDFAPMGIDTRGKLVLGYSEIELVTTGSGYQFIHAADMMYCADNHLRMMKTGDSGFTFFRLLTKTGHWLWVQASARVVFKGGRPDFIIARQKALTNEEGEEHLRQRRLQLPFNLTTGEGILYDSLDATEPTAEKPLGPTSLLGSLRRQDHSIYTQLQAPSPPLQIFTQTEQPLEQAFLDSHALLSVPGHLQGSQKWSSMEDLASQDMIDSLEQILGDIGGGGIEGLEVEETELRNWENTLVRMNKERDAARELNHILANDVFSYVEEALRRETGVVQEQHPASVFSNHEHQWQKMTDRKCAGPKGVCEVGSQLLPPNSSSTQMTSTQSCHLQPEVTDQPWLPFTQNSHQQSAQNTLNHTGSQQTYTEPQGFHNLTLTRSSHGERGAHIANSAAVPRRQPAASRGSFIRGVWPAAPNQSWMQTSGPDAHTAACADVSLGHLSGDESNYPPENGLLQSPFFCWSAEAQMGKVIDPSSFPALPTGSINLSQNTGP